jgi:hypothetical protein
MIAEELSEQLGIKITKRQIDSQPLRLLGMHIVRARLTIDIIPEFNVVVYREGESAENYMIDAEELAGDVEEEGIETVVADVSPVPEEPEGQADETEEEAEVPVETVDLEETEK